MTKLLVEGLTKTYAGSRRDGSDSVAALDGVDLEVATGELVSIVGPSGCGKSTLLGIVAGLIPPSSGRVTVDGAEPDELLGRVGYLQQRDLLMPWRTVLDNTIVGLEVKGMRRREARRRAREQFPRFGLAGFEDERPSALSAGMRQRAAVLRAVLAEQELMLLDEPFVALDALTRERMRDWLLEVWRRESKTILLVTHDVEEAVFLSDQVHVMSSRPGRIVLSLDVELPRPRTPQITGAPEFLALKQRLLEPLADSLPGPDAR
jgi:ABC-type nitrate/sulfonate/bicarbonate transport system ATPase subunit